MLFISSYNRQQYHKSIGLFIHLCIITCYTNVNQSNITNVYLYQNRTICKCEKVFVSLQRIFVNRNICIFLSNTTNGVKYPFLVSFLRESDISEQL